MKLKATITLLSLLFSSTTFSRDMMSQKEKGKVQPSRKVSSNEIPYYKCLFRRIPKFQDPGLSEPNEDLFDFPAPGKKKGQSQTINLGNDYRMYAHKVQVDYKGNVVLTVEERAFDLVQDLKFKIKNYDSDNPPEVNYKGSVSIQKKGEIDYQFLCRTYY